MKSSSHKGARMNTSAGDHIEPLGNLKDEQKVTVPAKRSQEATSHLERQDKVSESNKHKEIMQRDGKTERRLLLMIDAGTVCQMTSYGWYSWCVAVLTLLATGAQGHDIDET